MSKVHVGISTREMHVSHVMPQISQAGALAFPVTLVLTGAILLALFLSILKLNNGTFIYSLDDPYISLALSDQIRHGNYGINAGLHAAPSSSILEPFLLAAASGTPLHPYLPLILNSMALFATLTIVWQFLRHLRLGEDTFGQLVQAVTVLLLALCTNLIGVVFTGLEHSLHIAVTAACIYGLALFLDSDEMPAWLPAAVVIGPLLRYEAIPLSIGVLAVFVFRGRWRTAIGAFALIVLCLGGFSAFLVSMRLPPLPSSVLAKSNVAANVLGSPGAQFLTSIVLNVLVLLFHPVGIALIACGFAAALRWLREPSVNPRHWTSQGLMAFALSCLVGGHMVAGRIGWLDRYEDYALLGTCLMGIYLMQSTIRSAMANKKRRLISSCATAVALMLLCSHYLGSIWKIPIAANNVYEQQFQMHRFINDYYRGPVAVNDLGLVSYHNPNFVLDLGGLGSEEGRILFMSHSSPDAYRALVDRNKVKLVIIFDEWFTHKIPASWVKVASMDQSRECVSCAEREVQFYATDAFTASTLRSELQSFRESLPPRVKLTICESQSDQAREASNLGPILLTRLHP